MQPVVSPVGYGSSFSFRGGDLGRGMGRGRQDEETPLVMLPLPTQSTWSLRTSLSFGILIAILAIGTVIGIHLLLIQHPPGSQPEPDDSSLILIRRNEWSVQRDNSLYEAIEGPMPLRHIAVVQTGSVPCKDISTCMELLNDLQADHNGTLPYNFLVSSNGVTFEALGWKKRSPMFPEYPLVVAFIGEFSRAVPTTSQLEEAITLCETAIIEGHVIKYFTIVGKITKTDQVPTYLFASLQNFKKWDRERSDEY